MRLPCCSRTLAGFQERGRCGQWIQSNEKLSDAIFEDEPEEETQDECHGCPGGGIVFVDLPHRLDAELLRGIEEMAEFYLRKYGKKTHTTEEEWQMKKRYKVHFTLEGFVELGAPSADAAEQIVADMERSKMLEHFDFDEYAFSTAVTEVDEGE